MRASTWVPNAPVKAVRWRQALTSSHQPPKLRIRCAASDIPTSHEPAVDLRDRPVDPLCDVLVKAAPGLLEQQPHLDDMAVVLLERVAVHLELALLVTAALISLAAGMELALYLFGVVLLGKVLKILGANGVKQVIVLVAVIFLVPGDYV